MIEKLKKWLPFHKEKEEKTIILCIHGFGRRLSHEYDNFKLWNDTGYEMVTFDIYHLEDEQDCNPTIWIRRCEGIVESYLHAGYKINIIGFSMGGVLATHIAAKYKINRLFLISPAFDYFHVGNITNTVVNKFKKSNNENTNEPIIPSGFTSCFMEVVRLCKDDIDKVKCPILFVHGDEDETIPLRSSINAYEKVKHNNKKLIILHEGRHRLMMHENTGWEVYQLFKLFINETILGKEISFAPDIFKK